MSIVIDAHIHVSEIGDYHGLGIDCSVEKLLSQMSAANVDKGILVAVPGLNSNNEIARICNLHPDKFTGMGIVDPNDPGAIDELKRMKEELCLCGLKLHPRMGKFSLKHESLIPICERAGELSLLVEFCLWPAYPGPLSEMSPYTVEPIIQKCPNTKFILGHVGGIKMWESFMMCRAYSNVYLDFTYSIHYFRNTSYFNDIRFMMKKAKPERCMVGSDFPEISLYEMRKSTQKVIEGFTKKEQDFILGGTIMELIGSSS